MTALGGEHATARRMMAEEAFGAIVAMADRYPPAAIARILGLHEAAVRVQLAPLMALRAVERPSPAKPMPLRIPPKPRPATRVENDNYRAPMYPVARACVRRIADEGGFTFNEIIGRAHSGALWRARNRAYYELWEMRTPHGTRRYSLPLIAAWFGGRDHTTILHGWRRHKARLAASQAAALPPSPQGDSGMKYPLPASIQRAREA